MPIYTYKTIQELLNVFLLNLILENLNEIVDTIQMWLKSNTYAFSKHICSLIHRLTTKYLSEQVCMKN
jgi:hypothetical protein